MITLEELYRRSKDSNSYKKDKYEMVEEESPEETKQLKLDSWKPHEIKDFVLPEFKIPTKKSNNYESAKRVMLSKILAFVEFTQRKRIKYGCTAMPIPTTSKRNLSIWGYKSAVSRAIKFMIEIGLISVYDETYRFGCPYKGGNYGKTYAYYKENEDKLIQYCKDNNIHKFVIESVVEVKTKEQQVKVETIDRTKLFKESEVLFSKNLKLDKPDGISRAEFEDYLTLCLYNNYPEFKFMQGKVKEINEYYKGYPEFMISFQPHFSWDEKNINRVVKIGIRATNEFCNKAKSERAEILKEYGLDLQKDIRSSVPRLTLSINNGEWVDESVDIYKLVNEEFEPGSEFTQERRDAIKHYHLVSYFEEGSDKLLGKNVTYKLENRKGIVKTEVDELIGRLRKSALKVEGGKFYGSEIFYVESCVYLMTVYDLLSSGYMVWLVYDAFYAKGEEDQETFNEMINNGVKSNFNLFLERSKFNSNCKKRDVEEEICKKITLAELMDKYKDRLEKTSGVKI